MVIFSMMIIVAALLGLYGLIKSESLEELVQGPNLPALFLHLLIGNNPDQMIYGDQVQSKDSGGHTTVTYESKEPLIYAALNTPFSTQKIMLLRWFGANPNAVTEGGDTTLSMAISWEDRASACYLVKHGAHIATLSKEDKDALSRFHCST